MSQEPAREVTLPPVAPPVSPRAVRGGVARRALPKLIVLCGSLLAGLAVGEAAVRWIALSPKASPGAVAFCDEMTSHCPAPVRAGFGRSLHTLDLYESVPRLGVVDPAPTLRES